MDEIVADLLRLHQRGVALGQGALDVHGGGDVREGQQGRAIGQGRGGAIDGAATRAQHPALEAGARIVEAGDERAQFLPVRLIAEGFRAGAGDFVDMGLVGQGRGGEAPEALERGIVQLQAAVAAEHRHAFAQGVEGFALHAHEGIVAGLQMEPLGHIVEEIGDAALRVGIDDGAQGPAVRQIPDLLDGLDRLIGAHHLRLPGAEVRLFGQAALGAQAVEDFGIGRVLVEEGLVEIPQVAIGGVVEGEALAPVENGHGGGELIKGARMRVHLARQIGPRALQFRKVRRLAHRPACAREVEHIHQIAAPGDHRMHAAAPQALARARRRRSRAIIAVEQFELARHRIAAIARLDCARIGGVDPGQGAIPIARPHGRGQCVQQTAQGLELGPGGLMVFPQLGQFEPVAGDVADAQHGAAAHGAALGFEMAARQAGQGKLEPLAPAAQGLHGAFQRLGGSRREPGAEGQRLARTVDVADQRQVARDVRLVRRCAPGDEDLRLGGEENIGAVQIGAGGGEIRRQHGFAGSPCPAASQMDQRGGGGDAGQGDHEEQADERLRLRRLLNGARALGHGARRAHARQQGKRGEAGDRQGDPGCGGPGRDRKSRDKARSVPRPLQTSHLVLPQFRIARPKAPARAIQRANHCTLLAAGLLEEVVNQMKSPPRGNAEANFCWSANKGRNRTDQ